MENAIIAASSGLVGAAIGGFATYRTTVYQVNQENKRIELEQRKHKIERIVEKLILLNNYRPILWDFIENSHKAESENSKWICDERIWSITDEFLRDSTTIASWIILYFDAAVGKEWNQCLHGMNKCSSQALDVKSMKEKGVKINWDEINSKFNEGSVLIDNIPMKIIEALKKSIK